MPPAAENGISRKFADIVEQWVDLCQRRAVTVIVAALLVSVAASAYLVTHLRIDTDTEDMLSADLAFRQNAINLDRAFPQLEDNLLVVLDAPNADAADDGVRGLAAAMRGRADTFNGVFAPEADPFLRRHGLLYLDLPELEDLSGRLTAAQPFLGTLWQQPNLIGLSEMLGLLLDAGEEHTLGEAALVLGRMADVASRVRAGEITALVWSDVILAKFGDTGPSRRLIVARPKLDYGSLHPASRASDEVYDLARAEGLMDDGFNVRLTGSAALESDELKSVEVGMGLAGIISLCIVVAVLLAGLRSIGVMIALLLTLIAGLIWTAAFAILALGSLNLISVAFAVLFVGLSVDFGIHFALRASEYVKGSGGWGKALGIGGESVGGSLAVCALTTAIAFFSFLPTDYVGLAELGLIAGVGMFVALVCNLTILPALLRVLVRRPPTFADKVGSAQTSRGKARRAAYAVVVVGIVSAVVSGWFASGARFDFDPMNLKDPNAPSMQTLFDLMKDGSVHPYSAEVLADDAQAASTLASKLEQLPVVDRVHGIHDLVPNDQEAKLGIIDRMALILGPAFYAPKGTTSLDGEALRGAVSKVLENVQALRAHPQLGEPAVLLLQALKGASDAQTVAINQALFKYLPGRLDDLALALDAGQVDMDTLPVDLKRRYVSEEGQVRLDVIPVEDLRDPEKLRAYVSAVQKTAPNATGAPVVIFEAGRAVLDAFGLALMISLAGIGCVLWLVLRRIGDVLLIFLPVCVAALWTLAVSAIADVPFNFANVIVLPLLFGLSVDFGVHIVMRQRGGGDAMTTTTPRAVLLSALTTLGSFGSIMLSGHPGTASMGLLLSIAIILSLVSMLVLLPALLRLFMPDRSAD